MSFFDSKLEVLDFQLTQYGKHLLSLGKLNPNYYAFYDQDVIYDYQYAGITESQNSIEPRIQENTPRLKTQYIFHGAETELANGYDLINTKNKLLFYDHIGTSKYEGTNTPTWDVKILNNSILSSTPYFTSSFNKIINLPQLNLNLDYDLYYVDSKKIELAFGGLSGSALALLSGDNDGNPDEEFTPSDIETQIQAFFNNETNIIGPYEDDNFVAIEQKDFVIDVLENNSFDEKDSFEIEVFEYITTSSGSNPEDNLKQLYFFQNYYDKIKNNIMLNATEVLSQARNITLTNDYVEYYFNLKNDNFISNDVVCKHIDNGIYNLKQKNKYKNIIKCKNTTTATSPALPSSIQLEEKCDV